MAGEYTAQIAQPFIPTVIVNWKGKRVRLNYADYVEQVHGPILESPLTPPIPPGRADPPLKNPFLDGEGRRIADLHSPMHRA